MSQLREKHPEPQPAKLKVLLRCSVQDVSNSLFLAINGEMVRDVAKKTKGSGGPCGVDATFKADPRV